MMKTLLTCSCSIFFWLTVCLHLPFRTDLHAEGVDERHRPEIGLGGSLEEELVLECLGGLRSRTVFSEGQIAQLFKARLALRRSRLLLLGRRRAGDEAECSDEEDACVLHGAIA